MCPLRPENSRCCAVFCMTARLFMAMGYNNGGTFDCFAKTADCRIAGSGTDDRRMGESDAECDAGRTGGSRLHRLSLCGESGIRKNLYPGICEGDGDPIRRCEGAPGHRHGAGVSRQVRRQLQRNRQSGASPHLDGIHAAESGNAGFAGSALAARTAGGVPETAA